jgi:hypothetical protein
MGGGGMGGGGGGASASLYGGDPAVQELGAETFPDGSGDWVWLVSGAGAVAARRAGILLSTADECWGRPPNAGELRLRGAWMLKHVTACAVHMWFVATYVCAGFVLHACLHTLS